MSGKRMAGGFTSTGRGPTESETGEAEFHRQEQVGQSSGTTGAETGCRQAGQQNTGQSCMRRQRTIWQRMEVTVGGRVGAGETNQRRLKAGKT